MKRKAIIVKPVGGAMFAFVRLAPAAFWVQTHPSAAFVTCSHCGAVPGEACRGSNGVPGAGTHVSRRKAMTDKHRSEARLVAAAGMVIDIERTLSLMAT